MTPDYCKATYRRFIDLVGELVIIRRYSGSGANRPHYDVEVKGRVVAYLPHENIGTIQQGDKKLVILADDLLAGQISLPLHKGDKAVIRGKEHNIESPDDNTRRIDGVLIAYEIQVRG